jgi:hypothetical protein
MDRDSNAISSGKEGHDTMEVEPAQNLHSKFMLYIQLKAGPCIVVSPLIMLFRSGKLDINRNLNIFFSFLLFLIHVSTHVVGNKRERRISELPAETFPFDLVYSITSNVSKSLRCIFCSTSL